MNFEGFQKFCIDFGIFPDILSKPKIFRFFKTLANFYQEAKLPGQNQRQNQAYARGRILSPSSNHPGIDFSLKDRPEFNSDSRLTRPVTAQTPVQDYIDEHLFIEALALAAFEVVYREP